MRSQREAIPFQDTSLAVRTREPVWGTGTGPRVEEKPWESGWHGRVGQPMLSVTCVLWHISHRSQPSPLESVQESWKSGPRVPGRVLAPSGWPSRGHTS